MCWSETTVLFSNCSHSGSLRLRLIILYEKCLRRESECVLLLSNAAVSAKTLSYEIYWQISPKKVEKVKAVLTAMSACPWLDGTSVKTKEWECGKLGMALQWMMLNKEWAALQKRRRWTDRAGGGVLGGDGGWKKPAEQTALLVQSCLFKVTALTDTTRPGGCLQDKMLLPFRGSDWQLCMALDNFRHAAGDILLG